MRWSLILYVGYLKVCEKKNKTKKKLLFIMIYLYFNILIIYSFIYLFLLFIIYCFTKAWLKIPPYILPGSTAQTITQILIRRQGFPALSAALEQFAQKEPAAHEILQLLLRLFYEVQLHSSSNQMRAEMIATVFAPSIVECPTIDDMSSSTSMLTQLISFSPLLFPAKPLESHPSE